MVEQKWTTRTCETSLRFEPARIRQRVNRYNYRCENKNNLVVLTSIPNRSFFKTAWPVHWLLC